MRLNYVTEYYTGLSHIITKTTSSEVRVLQIFVIMNSEEVSVEEATISSGGLTL